MAKKLVLPVFWTLVGVFVVIVIVMQVLMGLPVLNFFVSAPLFFLLGLALIILAVRTETDRIFKRFLILTGSAAVGMSVSALLHNVVYGAFIQWFGADFWKRIGVGDEPFFFIMAVVVCPVAYLVGVVGSIVLILRRKKYQTRTM